MAAERLAECFERARNSGHGALLPYFTAGYPDSATTAELVRIADSLAVTAVELGVPYSDSIADGPIIQGAFSYALDHGRRLSDVFQLVSDLRPTVQCGLIAMVSYSIVHRAGLERFLARAAEAGLDGVIFPDLPLEESDAAVAAAARADLCHIGLVAPSTPAARCRAIADRSTGFVYRIAVSGTTGERDELPAKLAGEVSELQEVSGLPVCVGFGVGNADQVREICGFADGVIVGSAIARRIGDALERGLDRAGLVSSVSGFLRDLMAGTSPDGP